MNLLVVGASYRTAPVELLERLAVPEADLAEALSQLLKREFVGEAVLLSTCNRVEVYAAVTGFHGGLGDISAMLAQRAGRPADELAPHLYVHYDTAAVEHVFRVAAGLDSMVVGEAQVLGQLRDAYHGATGVGTAGRLLHELMQQALRVGKRAHAETGIDRAGRSMVSAALELAAESLGGSLTGRPALVIGAGAMGSLAIATLARAGAGPLAVANRSADRAHRLAETYEASAVPFAGLADAISGSDIVVTATASSGQVLTRESMLAVMAERKAVRSDALVILDLAVPRDVDPAVGELPGVRLVDVDRLAGAVRGEGVGAAALDDVAEAEQIVAVEAEGFLAWQRGADVAPTVAALRARADDVVTAELNRLAQRRPDLTDTQRAEVARAVHRVVQRLLHSPTVRVRELAAGPGGDQYAVALRELFDLQVPRPGQASDVPELDPPGAPGTGPASASGADPGGDPL